MKISRNTFRIIVGLVFIFSGFVKGIDPWGTVYRMEDYFLAFNMAWAMPFSHFLSVFLCVLEFSIGISLLLNLWIRKTSWILLPMMTFFTVLTFFDAVYNIVPDCGCFGDAIKLTNVETFIKNLLLMMMVIPIFLWRNKFKSAIPAYAEIVFLFLTMIAFAWLSIYSYRHLPLIDFMPWKVGNNVNQASTLPIKFYVTYKNRHTGEEKEFVAPDYPWNDTVWLSNWIFKSQRVENPNMNEGSTLRVEDEKGNVITSEILDNPDYHFLFISYDLTLADPQGFLKILPFYKKALIDGYSFVCITSSLPQVVKNFRIENGTAFDFYYADDIVLKMMVRANPGLILLKHGVVLAKWHYRDIPPYEEIKRTYMDQ